MTPTELTTRFGPSYFRSPLASFSRISQDSYRLYHQQLAERPERPLWHQLFLRLAHLAETTSFSIRLLSSWDMALQALALLRTRLENVITCSYLLHEEPAQGVEPYMQFIAVKNFKNVASGISEPQIAERLDDAVDIGKLRREAEEAQKHFNPGFDIVQDKFERKWTNLDLHSMATARDRLVSDAHLLSRQPLGPDYLSVFKIASSVVHSDGVAVSHGFLSMTTNCDEVRFVANQSWADTSAAFCARYDIIQCFEVLTFLDINPSKKFLQLQRDWQEVRDKHWG